MATLQPTNKTAVVILAAGEGKRMQSDLPKVMHVLHGKPLIEYVVKAVEDAGLPKPAVVISAKTNLVPEYLSARADYVVQAQQLGTGHAVAVTEDTLKNGPENVVVLYGDMPSITPESIRALVAEHESKRNVVTLMTTTVPNFEGNFSQFADFGRIVRCADGHIVKSVEKRDATAAELAITELNSCVFCFDASWLWSHLKLIRNSNAQGEYYLTDLVALAINGGYPLSTLPVAPEEVVGVNSQEQLAALSKKISKK